MINVIRVLFIVACIVMGALWANQIVDSVNATRAAEELPAHAAAPWMIVGGFVGAIASALVIFVLRFVTTDVFQRLSPALVSVALAMIVGYLLAKYVRFIMELYEMPLQPTPAVFLSVSVVLVFTFIGISLGLTRASNWESLMNAVHKRQFHGAKPKLIDTSVIIDGRIADVCKTGFIEGTFLIPRFVLKELQNIADSADVLRRARGRRGLDIIKMLQEDPDVSVDLEVIEDDPTDVQEVDGKLVRLAQDLGGASIITNDLNLNKVAQIEGVTVLNINDLANALKPAVLPDEDMQVRIVKEGKEAFQGVGYLDDGTMIVVDGGKDYVGKDVTVLVTSVLQTTAGRMIFTKLRSVL
jgi:uncharacterized protein YacL